MGLKPGYKQTEVGVIPEEWETCSLKQITLNMLQGVNTAIDKPEYVRDGIPMLKANNVIDEEVVFEGADHISRRTFSHYSDRFKLKKNDFLFSNIGARLGTGSLLKLDVECSFAWNVMRIVPDTRKVTPEYLCFLINSPKCSQEIRSKQSGSGMGFVPKGVMQDIVVALPLIEEQRAIAEALNDVDALLGALEKLIAKKRNLKQAAMQQLLTGQKRLPGFSGDWDVKMIEDLEKTQLLSLSRGNVISKKDIERTPGDFPIYSSSVKGGGIFGCYGKFMFDEELITWSIDGGGDFFYRPKHKFSVTNVCGFMRANASRISYPFLAAQLKLLHGRQNYYDYQTKAHPSVIRKAYEVVLPKLDEQTAIAEVLSDMDAEIAALEQRLAKTRAIKQGMMQELLTGKTRLVDSLRSHEQERI